MAMSEDFMPQTDAAMMKWLDGFRLPETTFEAQAVNPTAEQCGGEEVGFTAPFEPCKRLWSCPDCGHKFRPWRLDLWYETEGRCIRCRNLEARIERGVSGLKFADEEPPWWCGLDDGECVQLWEAFYPSGTSRV